MSHLSWHALGPRGRDGGTVALGASAPAVGSSTESLCTARRRRGRRALALERPVLAKTPLRWRIVASRPIHVLLFALITSLATGISLAHPSADDVTGGCRRASALRTADEAHDAYLSPTRCSWARSPFISPARDGGALPQEHSAGVRDRPGVQFSSPRGVHHEPRTGRLWRTAGAGLLRRGP